MGVFISLFITICNAGYQASIAVGILILVRFIMMRLRFPRRYICFLWLIPFLRLMLPVIRFNSAISLMPEHYEPIPTDITVIEQTGVSTGQPYIDRTVNRFLGTSPVLENTSAAVSAEGIGSPVQWTMQILVSIWVAGIILLTTYELVSLLMLRKKISTAVLYDAMMDSSSDLLHDREGRNKRDRSYRVYLADGLSTAFVLGLLHPCIYLPSDISPEAAELVIWHEYVHIRRRDHLVKIAAFILLGIYWFHPLIWAAFILMNRDMEFACDEMAVEGSDPEYRRRYSAALLTLSVGRIRVLDFPLAFSEGNPKSRIRNIASYRKPVLWVSIISAVVVCTLGISLLASPQKSEVNTEADSEAAATLSAAGDEQAVVEPIPWERMSEEEAAAVYMPIFRAYLECPDTAYFAWVEEIAEELQRIADGEAEPGEENWYYSDGILSADTPWEQMHPEWSELFTENGYKEFLSSYKNGFFTYQQAVHDIGAVTEIRELQLSSRDIGYDWTCTVRLYENPEDRGSYSEFTLEGLIRKADDGRVDYFERKTEQGLSVRLSRRLEELAQELADGSSDGPTETWTAARDSEESNVEIPVISPTVDLAGAYGANPVELLYADESRIVFAGYFGLFVYAKKENRIIRGVDLSAIGCQFTQGDAACEKKIYYNGEKVLLHPMNAEYVYIYDIPENRLEKSLELDLIDNVNYTSHTVMSPGGDGTYAYDTWVDQDGVLHATCISELWGEIGRMYWFDALPDDWTGDSIMRPLFPAQGYEKAVPFDDPAEVRDLTEIAMRIKGEMRTVADPEILESVEKLFSDSERQENGSGCPFYDCMYFTRKDGVIGFLNPATDSCNILRTSSGWYKYRTDSGSNEEFWSLFDGWLEALWAQ